MIEQALISLSLVPAGSIAELVTMWRIELLHPATMHFSIALTIVGTGFWFLGGTQRWWPRLRTFDLVGSVTIALAAIGAWIAVQTGFWADEAVGRELYDPRPLKDHENLAVNFAWLITATALLDLARRWQALPARLRSTAWLVVAVLLILASGLVSYTAHLGAGLVYQQGAGVQMPSPD